MTVDNLIERLREISDMGDGDLPVVLHFNDKDWGTIIQLSDEMIQTGTIDFSGKPRLLIGCDL